MLSGFSEEIVSKFWAKVRKSEGCWEWLGGKDFRGYGRFSCGYKTLIGPHRFSWMIHYGGFPIELNVCHKCDNPSCVRPDHLFLGTQSDNNLDAVAKGRQIGAKKRDTRKLTKEEILQIRKTNQRTLLKEHGMFSQRRLAERYGVSPGVIQRIVENKTYKEIV